MTYFFYKRSGNILFIFIILVNSYGCNSQNSLGDSIANFYKKSSCHFNFTYKYYSSMDGPIPTITKGSFGGYRDGDIKYRITIDTVISGGIKYIKNLDAVKNNKFVGYNSSGDTTYTDARYDSLDFDNTIGLYKPNHIFFPDDIKENFKNTKQYLAKVTSLSDIYLISFTDTNVTYDSKWNATTTKTVLRYTVSKKDYRILRYFGYYDYIMANIHMQDSSEFIYEYKYNKKEQIIKYVNSFVPFKKPYKRNNAFDLQDTVSIFPNFTLPDSTSKNYVSSSSTSKYTLVEFWYKSCGPCINNMKRLNSVKDSIDNSILEIVAINDADKLNDDLLKFIRKFNIKYKVLFNGQELRKKLNISAHPSTYIFDNSTHRVVYYAKGTSDGYSEEIIRHMRNLVK